MFKKKIPAEQPYTSFHPGRKWLDTEGRTIEAHGFSVFWDERDQCYYWVGENKEFTKRGGTIWTYGINLYSSGDLYNWEKVGCIVPPAVDDLTSPMHPTYCIDRPRILYCKKTGRYVMWIKVMAGEVSQFMHILTAERIGGPYVVAQKFYNPLGMDSGDFALYADEETGKAYIFFERPHFQLICATLTDDYTACDGEYSVHYDGLTPPLTREAPTFFERDGRRYLFTSGTSGYYPNESRVCVFEDFHGRYRDLGDPCIGDRSGTTFNSQISSVVRVRGTDRYIACADRWMPYGYIPRMAKQIQKGMERHFRDYEPDRSGKHVTEVSGKLQKHSENTRDARYVWLPIEWDGIKPVLRWKDEWQY